MLTSFHAVLFPSTISQARRRLKAIQTLRIEMAMMVDQVFDGPTAFGARQTARPRFIDIGIGGIQIVSLEDRARFALR